MSRRDEIEQLLRKQFEIDKLMRDKELMKYLGGTVQELEKACYESVDILHASEEARIKPIREVYEKLIEIEFYKEKDLKNTYFEKMMFQAIKSFVEGGRE